MAVADRLDGLHVGSRGAPRRLSHLVPAVAALAVGLAACSGGGSPSGTSNAAGGSSQSAAPGQAAGPQSATLTIAPSGSEPMNPKTPVTVKVAKGKLTTVTVTNAAGVQITGALSADHTTWASNEPLGYSKAYQVQAAALGADGHTVQATRTLQVLTPRVQAYPELTPAPGYTDVGIGQPIVVYFDQPVTDHAAAEKAITITSSPSQPGSFYWMSNTEVHYRPPVYWKPGTNITINVGIYGVNLGGGVYGQTDRTLRVHVHDAWVAKANGRTEQLAIYHNGLLLKTVPISLGSPGFPTHEGPHVISEKAPSVIMDSATYGVGPGQPGYYRETVYLDERISNDGEFVHSAPWSVGQQGNANVSHGCVNLSPENANWFYHHFNVGDVVEITNSGGHKLPVWDHWGDWELSWPQWLAGA